VTAALKVCAMSEPKPIRVLIVDDHPIVRVGMEVTLNAFPDIRVVGQANNSEHALALCARFQPDVVLMDLMMPQVNGVEATRRIRSQFPQIQVIVFTSFQEQNLVQEALRAGAIGYLLKDASSQELVTAVRTAVSGKTTLSPDVLDVLIHSITQPSAAKAYDLTERELEVLLQMVEGLTNHEIASNLVVSINTVRHHVRNILMKLDVTNRTAAVRLAVDEQLVPVKSAHRSNLPGPSSREPTRDQ
jgi:NarL family two-component system response regulator LiaR